MTKRYKRKWKSKSENHSSYRLWVVGYDNNEKFTRTYHSPDLLNFTEFLDRELPNWSFFNVYDKESGLQLANFTKFDKPRKKRLNY
jgi:hypothetical protein